MKICKQNLIIVNTVMYYRKNFYLKDEIDEILFELSAAGFLEYWIRSYADPEFLYVKQRQSRRQPMKIHQLFGVFNLCFIGLAISSIVFVVELSLSSLKQSLRLNYIAEKFTKIMKN